MKTISDISYQPDLGFDGLGDLYIPDNMGKNTPVALAIHGGGWVSQEKTSFAGVAEFLCEQGFAVFNINYRLCGTAPWPACGDDCISAARFLLDNKPKELQEIDYNSLFVIGGSAGGHLALMTGMRLAPKEASAIVSISGIADLAPDFEAHPGRYKALLGHEPTESDMKDASPMSYVSSNNPPILFTHSTFDKVVSIESPKGLIECIEEKGNRAETYFYDLDADGHSIWIPESDPHRLYPDIEKKIRDFIVSCDTGIR